MTLKPDVEVLFKFTEEMKTKVFEGYRPSHLVTENYLTTGVHRYYNPKDCESERKGTITFITPEAYPNTLWVGKKIKMFEGSKMIGYAIILNIYNRVLERGESNTQGECYIGKK